MLNLITLALAPVLICAFYIYIRDKYEKEPLRLLFLGVLYGCIITVPIVHTENFVTSFLPTTGEITEAMYLSYVVAALVEEGFKFIILFFLVWSNNNFNERFDGIVYAVFISLGFAGLENILYVLNPEFGGLKTAFSRAIFSVPGHALFGVSMGYYFSLIKFVNKEKIKLAVFAFVVPWFLHGTYDFILMANIPYYMALFIPFVVYLWVKGFKNMKQHIKASPFKAI